MWVTSCFCWRSSCCNVLRWPVCKQYALPPKKCFKGIKKSCNFFILDIALKLCLTISLIHQHSSSWGFPWILLGQNPDTVWPSHMCGTSLHFSRLSVFIPPVSVFSEGLCHLPNLWSCTSTVYLIFNWVKLSTGLSCLKCTECNVLCSNIST